MKPRKARESPVVKLWNISCGPDRAGVWEQMWFLEKREAEEVYNQMLKEGYISCFCDPSEGGRGCITEPLAVDVPLNAEGILDFAQQFAVQEI